MDTQLQQHLSHLAGAIGCRLIGTAGNHAAADYIEQVFTNANLAVRRQTYPCPAWKVEECNLTVAGFVRIASANTFSPFCDIRAKLAIVRTVEELEAADPAYISERILFMCGELTTDPIMPLVDHAVYLPERDKKIGLLLREKHPKAVLTVSMAEGYTPLLLEDHCLDIPSATMPADVFAEILRRGDEHSSAWLTINSEMSQGETSNVIGLHQCTANPQDSRRIIICAHYDTKHGTPGAWDNASGVAALLQLAQHYATESPPISLEFCNGQKEDEQFRSEASSKLNGRKARSRKALMGAVIGLKQKLLQERVQLMFIGPRLILEPLFGGANKAFGDAIGLGSMPSDKDMQKV
ncbi:MAG: M28 family peptidase, partial [Chloroflexota bacterium]